MQSRQRRAPITGNTPNRDPAPTPWTPLPLPCQEYREELAQATLEQLELARETRLECYSVQESPEFFRTNVLSVHDTEGEAVAEWACLRAQGRNVRAMRHRASGVHETVRYYNDQPDSHALPT